MSNRRTERKSELLAELGVDGMVAYPTDEALLALEPEAFFERLQRMGIHVDSEM